MLESKIQSNIIKRLKSNGWIVDKPVDRSHKGFPDITAYRDGETVFIEVKRPGSKLSNLQEFWIRTLKENGFQVYVMDNWRDLRKEKLI